MRFSRILEDERGIEDVRAHRRAKEVSRQEIDLQKVAIAHSTSHIQRRSKIVLKNQNASSHVIHALYAPNTHNASRPT